MHAGETLSFSTELEAGDLLHVIAEQDDVDVALRLTGPQDEELWRVDSPTGRHGPEELVAIVGTAGRYRIAVVASKKSSGYVTLHEATPPHPATDDDRALVDIDRLYHHGRRLYKQGELTKAIALFHRGLPVSRRLGLEHREANFLRALCLAHEKRGKNAIASTFCDRAADLYQKLDDRRRLASTLSWSGWLQLRLGRSAAAIGSLERAVTLFDELADESAAECESRLGVAYHRRGDVARAFEHLDRALQRVGPEPSRSRATVLSDLANVFLSLDLPGEAMKRYREAAEIFERLGDREFQAVALRGAADAAARRSKWDESSQALDAALATLLDDADPRNRGLTLETKGRIERLRGNFEAAREAFEKALELARQLDDEASEAARLLELGHVLNLEGAPAEGLVRLEEAVGLMARLGDELGLASTRARAAQALYALGQPRAAWERIASALDTVERQRAGAMRQDHRGDYFAARQDYFAIALDVLFALDRQEPDAGHLRRTFAIHERRLARELRDTLAAAVPPPDPALKERQRKLEQKLEDSLARAGGDYTPRIAETLDELHRLWSKREGGAALPPHPPSTIGLRKVQDELLDSETLLLVYSLDKPHSRLWAVTTESFTVHEINGRDEINSWVRRFTTRLLRRRADDFRRRLGSELRQALLGEVSDLLGKRRLAIVPDGALHGLPFAALPGRGGEGYLIEEHEIVVLPSVTVLAELRRSEGRRPKREAVAVIADPVFSPDDPRLTPGSGARRDLAAGAPSAVSEDITSFVAADLEPPKRLLGTRAEARAIIDLAPSAAHHLIIDAAASREAFLALEAEKYRLLHLATHAISSKEHPEVSGIVLSLVNAEGEPCRGVVRAFEISRLHLPLELVGLSACETGVGKELAGEGALGLARAFFNAGAARVLASLWKVGDQPSALLMEDFYEAYLKRGLAPAAALRSAQLIRIADPETAAPRDWAAFVLQGDWQSPDERSNQLGERNR